MNISNIIQLLLNIGTMGATLIALFALIEAIKQRRASMMPGLYIKNNYEIYILRNHGDWDGNTRQLESIWSKTKLEGAEMADKDFSILPNYSIELFNVGIGTATNIEYKWKFDIQYYIKRLKAFNARHGIKITYFDNTDTYLVSTGSSIVQLFSMKNDDLSISFLPSSQNAFIQLPNHFVVLFNLLHYSCFEYDNSEIKEQMSGVLNFADELKNIPLPELTVFYHDLAGKRYKKKYSFSLTLEMCSFRESWFSMRIKENK